MGNIRSISVRSIRNAVSVIEALLLFMVWVSLSELDELFAIWVHSWIILVTALVANAIFDMWRPWIQEYTSCIFNLFINIGPLFFLVMSKLELILRSKFRRGSSLVKLIHHISTVILRRLRFLMRISTWVTALHGLGRSREGSFTTRPTIQKILED
jgi:hypothetical protein